MISESCYWKDELYKCYLVLAKFINQTKVTVKASQNLHKEKASNYRMLFSFNHFSTGH